VSVAATSVPLWGTIVLTLGVAVIAAAAAIWGPIYTAWAARREREEADAAVRRAQGAQVLSPILVFLNDASPLSITFNKSDATPQKMLDLRAQWEAARVPLITYATVHPNPEVLERAEKLVSALWNSLTSTGWTVHAMSEGMLPHIRPDVEEGRGQELATARRDHTDAKALAHELLQLVRDDRPAPRRFLRRA
jgi:hypothetical protein